MRHEVNWPQDEPIPQSMEEALALGWEVQGSSGECASGDERTHTGTADIAKKVGLYELMMNVPFKATYTFGVPSEPCAVLSDDLEIRAALDRAARDGQQRNGRSRQVQ